MIMKKVGRVLLVHFDCLDYDERNDRCLAQVISLCVCGVIDLWTWRRTELCR
jgi:hypothetical protein